MGGGNMTKSKNTTELRTQPKTPPKIQVIASATETDPYTELIKQTRKETHEVKVPKPPTDKQELKPKKGKDRACSTSKSLCRLGLQRGKTSPFLSLSLSLSMRPTVGHGWRPVRH